ncbi:MAG: DUF3043 domain-containing protein [Propionibacteriaceae bacterium]|nr:DUF3043 domain-containing protein [Propionibacteriaceae bacterium]
MALFGRYQQQGSGPEPVAEVAPTIIDHNAGKGHRTPTRKEAQAARMEMLHPTLTKAQMRAQDREAEAKRRQDALRAADQKPERELLRNYVDARWSVTEFAMPLLLLMFVGMIMASRYPLIAMIDSAIMYLFLIAIVINIFIAWRGFRRELDERLPGTSTKGLFMMLTSRMVALRRWRTPGPAIPRHGTY